MENPYKTLTLHERDIQAIQEALTVVREQREGTERAVALNELWSDIDNQRAGKALTEQVICQAVKAPTQAGLSFSYSHYDCVVLTNEQYQAMGESEGRGRTDQRWKGVKEDTGSHIELWFRLKSAIPFDMKCGKCGKLIHKAITEV